MTEVEAFGLDKARLVGVYQQDDCPELKSLQLPLHVDDKLMLVVQFEDHISKKCSGLEVSGNEYNAFLKKYSSLDKTELQNACSIQDRDIFVSLSQLVPCVGCRRSVEHFLNQVQQFKHSVYESLSISSEGSLVISTQFLHNPKRLFHLFYYVRPKLYEVLEGVMNGRKNKRCVFHSLKMLKPNEYPSDSKYNPPKPWNCSVIDVWDRMCQECHKEVATLECNGILETMDYYLKKHRFCSECKSKVQRAFHMLTGDVDHEKEPGFCSAIFEGLKCCKSHKDKDKTDMGGGADAKPSHHVHVCCERGYIVHMLTQADAELAGGKKERHAKTIDIAQEEVCTCLSLYLYYRLHRVWHLKLTFEQTWFTVFYLSIELILQNFETCIEKKIGVGRMEALCQELEEVEKMKELKIQKKRLKRKRQKKKKEGQRGEKIVASTNEASDEVENNENSNSNFEPGQPTADFSTLNFHSCLLDMLMGDDKCDCTLNGLSDEDCGDELTNDEIMEFEKNRSEINAQRTRLRERIRQNFENFVVAANVAEP